MPFGKTGIMTPEQEEEIRTKDFFDMILPGTLKFMSDYYIVGDSFRSVWVIREYPPVTEEQAILSQLADRSGVTLRIYHRLVEAAEQRKIIQNAARRNRMKSGGTDVSETIEAEGNLQDVVELLANLRKNKEPLLHCSVFIELKAKSMDALRELQSDIAMELARSKISVDRLTLRQKEGFLSVIPTGSNQFGAQYERVLPASSVANLYPFNFSGKTDPGGLYIGRDKYGTNILVDFDRRTEDKTTSNILILGNSGQGKSYLLKLILTNLRESGKSVICLDPESEYEELCSELGGCYIDLMTGEYIINPLEPKAWADDTSESDDVPGVRMYDVFFLRLGEKKMRESDGLFGLVLDPFDDPKTDVDYWSSENYEYVCSVQTADGRKFHIAAVYGIHQGTETCGMFEHMDAILESIRFDEGVTVLCTSAGLDFDYLESVPAPAEIPAEDLKGHNNWTEVRAESEMASFSLSLPPSWADRVRVETNSSMNSTPFLGLIQNPTESDDPEIPSAWEKIIASFYLIQTDLPAGDVVTFERKGTLAYLARDGRFWALTMSREPLAWEYTTPTEAEAEYRRCQEQLTEILDTLTVSGDMTVLGVNPHWTLTALREQAEAEKSEAAAVWAMDRARRDAGIFSPTEAYELAYQFTMLVSNPDWLEPGYTYTVNDLRRYLGSVGWGINIAGVPEFPERLAEIYHEDHTGFRGAKRA